MGDQNDDDPPLGMADALTAVLQHVRAAHREAETAILNRAEMIEAARSFGASWEQLGQAMGMSRQTAHKRFGEHNHRHAPPRPRSRLPGDAAGPVDA